MTIARYEKYTVQVGDMQNMVSKRVYCISDKPTELIKIDILRKNVHHFNQDVYFRFLAQIVPTNNICVFG